MCRVSSSSECCSRRLCLCATAGSPLLRHSWPSVAPAHEPTLASALALHRREANVIVNSPTRPPTRTSTLHPAATPQPPPFLRPYQRNPSIAPVSASHCESHRIPREAERRPNSMSKNTSSKGKPKPGSKPTSTPRSRNTTPLPNVRGSAEPASSASYFRSNVSALSKKCDVTIEDILDKPGGSQSIQPVPSSALLISMRESIENKVLANVQRRCDVSNSALRELQALKKNRPSHDRDKDRAADKDAEERKHKLKKMKKAAAEDERPLAVGAHGVARQDGVNVHKGESRLPYITGPFTLTFTSI